VKIETLDLGQVSYAAALEVQQSRVEKAMAGGPATLIFVQHPLTISLGASFHAENLREEPDALSARGYDVVLSDRGGDVTVHGPGQLVAYPIVPLEPLGKDLHRWIRGLETWLIAACAEVGVTARVFPPNTGVWVSDEKVAAIGIKVRRWVSFHGTALNCDNDLSMFDPVVPCGIRDFGVTSLSQVLERTITVHEMKPILESTFARQIAVMLR
jgi:lipoate-protein ligase B